MLAADLVAGRPYAHRARHRDAGCEVVKVVYAGTAKSRKAKIRHACGGDLDGLEEWVPSVTLLCPWGERRAYLRDEERHDAIYRDAASHYDPVVESAISTIFEATGEATGFDRVWWDDPDVAHRLWRRAGLEGRPDQVRDGFGGWAQRPLSYTDRAGRLYLPWGTALEFAQAFAAAEPEPCIHYIQEEEDRLRAEGYEPWNRTAHAWLRAGRPANALVRDWTNAGDLALLREENERLRDLLNRARSALRQAGDAKTADALDVARRTGARRRGALPP